MAISPDPEYQTVRGVQHLNRDIARQADSCDRSYRMIESFEISNFRCFETLSLSGLSRVNVITGANASGKSALLEALLIGGRGVREALVALDIVRTLPVGNPVMASFGLSPPCTAITITQPNMFKSIW